MSQTIFINKLTREDKPGLSEKERSIIRANNDLIYSTLYARIKNPGEEVTLISTLTKEEKACLTKEERLQIRKNNNRIYSRQYARNKRLEEGTLYTRGNYKANISKPSQRMNILEDVMARKPIDHCLLKTLMYPGEERDDMSLEQVYIQAAFSNEYGEFET